MQLAVTAPLRRCLPGDNQSYHRGISAVSSPPLSSPHLSSFFSLSLSLFLSFALSFRFSLVLPIYLLLSYVCVHSDFIQWLSHFQTI